MVAALRTCAGLVDSARLRQALARAAHAHSQGVSLHAALVAEPAIDSMITLTVKQTPASELSVELDRLAEVFESRVQLSTRSVLVTWEVILIVLMTLFVGITVIALYLPMIRLIEML